MKYKIGDRVRIVQNRTDCMNGEGEMDKYLGTVMTIRRMSVPYDYYQMIEDRNDNGGFGWYWTDGMIEGLVENEDCSLC